MDVRRWMIIGCVVAAAVGCSDDDGEGSSEASATTVAPAVTTTAAPAAPTTSAPAPTTAAEPDISEAPDGSEGPGDGAGSLELETTLGRVDGGDSDVEGVREFLGIPYAEPPVGDNRWRLPEAHAGWDDPFEATTPGMACPQPTGGVVAEVTVIPETDEDCLTLSVWSPADAADVPVTVFFHGGSLETGSAHQPLYIGDHLASRGVVVITVNYRLGALGFLASELFATDDGDGIANFGFADQVLALEWVQENAASFGGDPGNVTIFGESAGGFSVCGHLAAPASAGLFHKAIVQSGGGCDQLQPRDAALTAGAELAGALGCDDGACLRGRPVDDVLAAGFDPVLVADGELLTTSASEQAARGEMVDVPVLTGANADEWTLFSIGAEEPTDDALRETFAGSGNAEEIAALYAGDEFDSNLARLQAFMAEQIFICPALEFAAIAPDTYAYHYTYVSSGNFAALGATHGAELIPLFGHPEGIVGLEPELDESASAVSENLQDAWVTFASTGAPGADWPAYQESGEVMLLDVEPELTGEIRQGRCADLTTLTGAAE